MTVTSAPAGDGHDAPSGISHPEFLQSALGAAGEWTRYADPKALGVLVLLGLGLTDLTSQAGRFVHPHQSNKAVCGLVDSHGHTCAGLAATGSFFLAGALAAVIVIFVTLALFSRMTLRGILGVDHDESQPKSRYFFAEVCRYGSEGDYATAVLAQTEDALLREMAGQVYQVSVVCEKKHKATQRAYVLTVLFLIVWAAGRILLALH